MDNLEGILAFCNDVRLQLGREPVPHLRKGSCADPWSCVVAGTINYGYKRNQWASVAMYSVYGPGNSQALVRLPESVSTFIDDFDAQRLPELIGEGWVE